MSATDRFARSSIATSHSHSFAAFSEIAARCVAVRDAEWELAAALKGELDDLTSRIRKLAPKRDQFRPERVRNVRNRNYR